MSYGLWIDYEYCSGCHTCEVACQKELGIEPTQFGIELKQLGPTEISPKKWQYDNVPLPTDRCNACAERVAKGKVPSCVQHCQAGCIEVGDVVELAKKLNGKHQVLFTLDA